MRLCKSTERYKNKPNNTLQRVYRARACLPSSQTIHFVCWGFTTKHTYVRSASTSTGPLPHARVRRTTDCDLPHCHHGGAPATGATASRYCRCPRSRQSPRACSRGCRAKRGCACCRCCSGAGAPGARAHPEPAGIPQPPQPPRPPAAAGTAAASSSAAASASRTSPPSAAAPSRPRCGPGPRRSASPPPVAARRRPEPP